MEEHSFGYWLRLRRKALDLSQDVLADRVGCSVGMIRKIESEERRPSAQIVERLAEIFNIPQTERTSFLRFARGNLQSASLETQQDFPWHASTQSPRSNLPLQLSSFIGRDREQREIAGLIASNRLITLVGPGGVGKTRLSLKIGEQVLEDYADGVWFIELAPILDPLLVPRTTAIAIGLRDEPQRPVIQMLSDYLHEKKMLIILDNCEHILDACAQLADTLLKKCPRLKILATSREALGIVGEAVYQAPSLQLPDMQQLLENFRDYESVRLFEERARLVKTDFSLTENAFSVAKICNRLDGIPLAIELAAARVSMFSTEQIAARLHESFDLLTGGSRTALPRHQTLQAAIDWSYDLLSTTEQILFQRLSIFVNGWTLEAAEAVASDAKFKSEHILDLLAQLIKKSLVYTEKRQSTTRYEMLETIRQYAHEKLIEADGDEVIRDRHLAYFVKLAERAEPELYRSNQAYWLNCLDDEFANFRTALEWALATNVGSGLRIAAIPWRFWQARGYFGELSERLGQFLEHYDTANSLHVQALAVYSFCMFRRGNFPETIRIAEQSLQMARALSDQGLEAFSLSLLGEFILLQGNMGAGVPVLEQSLALYRVLGDKIGQADALARLSTNSGDMERVADYTRESLRLYRELGHLSGITNSLTALARLTLWVGDFFSPVPWLEEAISISRQLGDQTSEEKALTTFGTLAYWQRDYGRATAYYQEAIILSDKIGDHYQNLWTHIFLAYAILRQGDIHQAQEMFENVIPRAHQAGSMMALVFAVEGLASLHVNQGQHKRAARLFSWTDAMREKIGNFRPPVEQASVEKDLSVIHTNLNNVELAILTAEGRAMTMEQAIAYVLETSTSL